MSRVPSRDPERGWLRRGSRRGPAGHRHTDDRPRPPDGPQVAADEVGHGVIPRAAELGDEPGGLAERELHQPTGDLCRVDRLERKPDGEGMIGSRAMPATVANVRSWNWVALSVDHGTPEPATIRSADALAAK